MKETTSVNDEATARGIDQAALVKDLRARVSTLEDDLRARAAEVKEFDAALREEYEAAREAERTAATYESWLDERVTQVAAAWVLGTVFVRFCEDNGLIPDPFLAGWGERLAEAEERHEAYFRERPQDNDRDWIIAAFDTLAAAHPTAKGLFDRNHNPLWEITPSFEAASDLIRFWRRRGDNGHVHHDFTDPELDTRFLGDLYQNLSENARKTYALLQTPEFVEEFVLDLTLTPAIEEFGLDGLRTIDPACGSGHFLLGIFDRLLTRWRAKEPGTDSWTLIRRSLESVHGCDKNPFAVSIARFRLLVAALRAAGDARLDGAAEFPINVAVGDSLIHGRGAPRPEDELFAAEEAHTYATEDVNEHVRDYDLLGRASYHVVVGNPPYITVKDKQENANYRTLYPDVCSGKYALSVPFAKRLFQLAVFTSGDDRRAGFVGQITANSFMKREFGKKLIQDYFAQKIHLTHVIDTSGAYIPGHGTPTVILVGRNHFPRMGESIRAVLGVRGEPGEPEIPAEGLVWSAILDQIGKPGTESEWVSVQDGERTSYSRFPWSLSGGGATDVFAMVEEAPKRLKSLLERPIGFASFPGQDEVFFFSDSWFRRNRVEDEMARPLVVGEVVRDWDEKCDQTALVPYGWDQKPIEFNPASPWGRHLWAMRRVLYSTTGFSGETRDELDVPWWTWYRWIPERYATPLSIPFAFVATHSHFVLDRGGKVFNRSAPVIKLPEGASEDEHLELLGVLNSSTACFWLKQVSQDKGNRGGERSTGRYAWESYFEFTGTKLQDYPLPQDLPLELGRTLGSLARRMSEKDASVFASGAAPTRLELNASRAEHDRIRSRMIALQEELDWFVYHSYGLLGDAERERLTVRVLDAVPEVRLGERAFEIAMAPRAAEDEAIEQWFIRHDSTPITEIPTDWPDWYREIVQNRIDVIEKRRDIALIERPECKRRWSSEPWEKKEAEALRTWLLDRCERRDLWFQVRDGFEQPRTRTVHQLADAFRTDEDLHAVARLYATDHLGKPDLNLSQVLERIVADQHVPYLAAHRYKDSGLRKRAQWEQVWELQREEDRTGTRMDIPVPPKYTSADFRKTSYWSQRGKLDVPKERFISYPDAAPGSDTSLLLGWAGWDHKDQAQALVNIVNDRGEKEGWGAEELTPVLAGLAEVMPWVRQWHGEYDEEWGGVPANEYQAFLDEQRGKHHLTEDDLKAWRPTGRRGGAKGERQ
ncbi:BREX-2 system adenine-specific DNA-methyltransferase PglX [Saccharopolyspora erythraea]|uniref:site-specific DNA-methyltransferase (adenine-specific) n=1 Tax=Saccharopolyspora erythraea (strain ATCC 11635 / DSM 40517 / JCM 4748 / NBRC 13426 / NCIMB 8594 / NRRL 2338) TaxID=405948 RepID=A4FK01_SACEN|nr:BREX-2 system adenine-specific DNA-methyltransferase PglX [Saccharopolyspora erythraea]EQD84161.1 DNA methylase [Saccharopolyspora erythraea D]QRK88135.1 BREX-2 system adenine-specific DNA-methyltransferase PglX [Saccharopolyspora erythraea]CAM04376.1 DNA methylase [Saccharopolyspora erythraea NRRL 2338]